MFKYFIALIIGAGLLACSAVNTITVDAEQVAITNEFESSSSIDSMIAPYKVEMEAQMDSVIAKANNDFTKGRPGGALNNWSADAIMHWTMINEDFHVPYTTMCLLNVGGLRNPISQGDVTVGDIYKLMPFDNEVVCALMPSSVIPEIEAYLKKSGGEPIAGARVEEGKFIVDGFQYVDDTTHFWIITSDYLYNGGDNMDFFEKSVELRQTGILMRDMLLNNAYEQGTLLWDNEIRISF